MEDYIKAIYLESMKHKVVRLKNVAEFLNVKTSSVNGALKILTEKGLVSHEKYGYIELTPLGKKTAKNIYERHNTLTRFIHNILGVDKNIAEEDACKMEHNIHKETVQKLNSFVDFIESYSNKVSDSFIEKFRKLEKD